jgi:hypothetical protein
MGLAVLDIILALLSKIGRITEFFYPKFSMMVLLQWIGYYSHCPISRFVFCLTHIQLAWHWVLHDYVHIPAYYDCSIERRTIEHHSVASKRSSDYKRCTTWLFKIRMTSWSDKIHASIVSTMLAADQQFSMQQHYVWISYGVTWRCSQRSASSPCL